MAYELIETVTVGSGGASSIEFTSIPQDGTDLQVLFSLRENAGSQEDIKVRFNSDSTLNYARLGLSGDGSNVGGFVDASDTELEFPQAVPGSSITANTFNNGSLYISNYTSSNQKSASSDLVTENNATEVRLQIHAFSYSGSAISSIIFTRTNSNEFVQYSTISLYKITAA